MTRWLVDFAHDLRFAIRSLGRTRTFTVIALLSLALGVGVNTAFFTSIHATALRPIPGVNEADRVVEMLDTAQGREFQEWTYPIFQYVRDAETPVEELAGWKQKAGSLVTADGGQHVNVNYVSANYFRVLGVVPAMGREFTDAEDDAPGKHPVAIVSHALWQDRFDGEAEIVGRTITLNRELYTVVGVAPEEFKGHRYFETIDLWAPLTQHPDVTGEYDMMNQQEWSWLLVLGRLRAGATVDQANAALETVFARLAQDDSDKEGQGARAVPFGPLPARDRAAQAMAMTAGMALVGVVLLIICGNVAGMVLARSVTREREIAVRVALGCGRGRLVRLLMAEASLLSLAGGALGVMMATWALRAITAAFDLPFLEPRLNAAIVTFSLAMILVTTLAVGLLPAIRFSRPELVSSLKDDAGGGGRRVGHVHRIAASAQTGLALMLLIICSLFLRAAGVMEDRELGFQPHGVLATRLNLSLEGYDSVEKGWGFLDRVRDSVGSVPGVTSLSIADGLPLDQVGNFTMVSLADRSDGEDSVRVEFTRASEGFFRTMGIPVVRGRGFESTDDAASEPVVVITQALAQRLFPEEEALGRQIRFGMGAGPAPPSTVIGVTGHVASSRATEDWPHIFVSLRQEYRGEVVILTRGGGNVEALAKPIQAALLGLDPDLPIPPVVTSESLVARSTEPQRQTFAIAGGLGVLALLLSAIGVYGVVAFAVANRTREIGLRVALGATRGQILWTVLRDGVRLAAPGLAIGTLLTAGLAMTMRSMLFGLSPLDPVSFMLAASVLFVVVLLASLIPARRAASIDPMNALRCE